jgi:mRNA interferase MazF
MAVSHHPRLGAVVLCDFNKGFVPPEMVKRRPAIVISPKISPRAGLCTVVPISTEVPRVILAYHVELTGLDLPAPWDTGPNWVKADMVYAVSLSRIDLFRRRSEDDGKRIYDEKTLPPEDLLKVRKAVLCGLGMMNLTKHL